MRWRSWRVATALVAGLLTICLAFTSVSLAQSETETSDDATTVATSDETAAEEEETPQPALQDLTYAIDNFVLFGAAVLVLFMQAGFAMLEVGLNSAKNAVNILAKNLVDVCLGVLLFYFVGYSLMYPGDAYKGGYFGFGGVGISQEAPEGVGEVATAELSASTLDPQVDFLFQAAFAATAATIVSGAVAGRMKFAGYLVYTAFLTGLIYPISGMWKWGYGWLDAMGFHDFAGSILVHAVGGFAALAGAMILGPRIGRFVKGRPVAMPGHNLTFAALGVFILWIGWYGFNPGSNLAFARAGETHGTMLIALNTTLAAAAGAMAALVFAWILFKKPDLTMALNGVLAGLVGITANCDCVTNYQAMIIGAVAGLIVVGGIILLDMVKIDDPVGAFPVHGMCGVWGGVATGIFGAEKLIGVQILGSLVIPLWAFATMAILFLVLKAIGLLRVSPEEEAAGLDITEHGMHAYPPSLVVDSAMSPAGAPIPVSAGGRT